jgi:Fur family zinc uptake transcriptional regulator
METPAHRHTRPKARTAAAVSAALRNVERLCDAKALRLTPMRRDAYAALFKAQRPMSAYELLNHLQTELERPLAPPLVYRALDFLTEQGLVHRLESTSAFVACEHPGTMHQSLYLVCSCCGTAEELEGDSVRTMLTRKARERHFQARRQVVEVHGLCEECAAAE